MLIDKNIKDEIDGSNTSDATCGSIKSKIKSKNLDKILMSLSAFSLQGNRSHMEDFFDIGYQMRPQDQQRPGEWPYEYFYFGIFDGHGGSDAARFAKENLLKFITKQPEFWSDDDADILKSIQIGYAATHEAMRKVMHNWPRTNHGLPSTAGTTASVLFIKNGKYYTGHVGDSRIVISRKHPDSKQWISQQITEDHKPESESEIARIRRAGGDVKSKVGVHRVVWTRPVIMCCEDCHTDYGFSHKSSCVEERKDKARTYPVCETIVDSYQVIPFLAIARSLGDFWSINPYSGQYIVSPEPDVACRLIDPNDECILLATDGLWSVVNSQQAVRALEEFKAVQGNNRLEDLYAKQYFSIDNYYHVSSLSEKDNYAFSLVYLAYQVWQRRNLRSDNITAVVAMLGDIVTPQVGSSGKQIYRTRSISNLHKRRSSIVDLVSANTIQIGCTRQYSESVAIDRAPTFETEHLDDDDINLLERLGNWLMLPPSAVPTVKKAKLMPPKNYIKLDAAKINKIAYSSGDIYVRRVSDDPLDEELLPERPGKKSGVSVRDASAQCTQSIHDFSRRWYAEYQEDLDDTDTTDNYDNALDRLIGDGEDDLDDEEDIDDHDVDEESPVEEDTDFDDLLFDNVELDVWSKGKGRGEEAQKPNTRRRSREAQNNLAKDIMLQPRSDNYEESPAIRRETRSGTYLSLTGDPKRKLTHDSPKAKRRKSHPLQCTVAQS